MSVNNGCMHDDEFVQIVRGRDVVVPLHVVAGLPRRNTDADLHSNLLAAVNARTQTGRPAERKSTTY